MFSSKAMTKIWYKYPKRMHWKHQFNMKTLVIAFVLLAALLQVSRMQRVVEFWINHHYFQIEDIFNNNLYFSLQITVVRAGKFDTTTTVTTTVTTTTRTTTTSSSTTPSTAISTCSSNAQVVCNCNCAGPTVSVGGAGQCCAGPNENCDEDDGDKGSHSH